MFLSGCGADANPSPRGSLELAREHGAALAQEVERVLCGGWFRCRATLATTLEYVDLPLQRSPAKRSQERTTVAVSRSRHGAADAHRARPGRFAADQIPCSAGRLAVWNRTDLRRDCPPNRLPSTCRCCTTCWGRRRSGWPASTMTVSVTCPPRASSASEDTKPLVSRCGSGENRFKTRSGSSPRKSKRSCCGPYDGLPGNRASS